MSTYDPKARAAYQVRGLGQLIGEAMNKDGTAVGEAINRCEAEFEKELRAAVEPYEKALDEILSIGERHVDEAVGRRIADFREAIEVARARNSTTTS